MILIAYIIAVFIGITLGLIGSGGSILAIPVLVYLLGIEPQIATVYSLFIIGFVSFVGSLKNLQDGLVATRVALLFGVPSILAIIIMRWYINPLIPNTICEIDGFILSKNLLIMLSFSILMILASISMINKKKEIVQTTEVNNFQLIIQGTIIGLISGFIGVGGGFLIIPALLFYANLPMNKAVATSLIIISINSIIGFFSSTTSMVIDWKILSTFTILSTVGIFIGRYLAKYISNEKLKPLFGYFVLITGIYILLKELILHN